MVNLSRVNRLLNHSGTPGATRITGRDLRAMWGWILLGCIVAALLIAGVVVATSRPTAPRLALVTIDGHPLALADLAGKVVLVNFWATSCEACVAEMPMLVKTQQQFAAQGYATVAIAASYDDPGDVNRFAADRALPFHVAFDAGDKAAAQFDGVQATPTSFLIDRHGRIAKRFVGAIQPDELAAMIRSELARS